MTKLLLALALILSIQCRDIEEDEADASLRILFLGNSLTYVNDLPSLVKEIASMNGEKIAVEVIALPDYAIDDHLNDGDVQSKLKSKKYDWVVAQQGPSALPDSQAMLKNAAINLANLCDAHHTKLALYMVWPSQARLFDHDNCITSYANAANASGSLLCPAGVAWKIAWSKDAKLPLYGADQFHPSVHGSLLAAMTIYASLKDLDDVNFVTAKKASWRDDVSDLQLNVMKEAVMELHK